MSPSHCSIERLVPPAAEADLEALARLLVEAVSEGEAVSFLAPLSLEDSARWWRDTLGAAHPAAAVLVARDGGDVVGTVQLHPAWAPNQPHRAEVAKLLVRRDHRGRGLGARLMGELERVAGAAGFGLLTLDAKSGAAAERLYRRLGWTLAGTIPAFAVDPDGVTPHDAVIMYKRLASTVGRPGRRTEDPVG